MADAASATAVTESALEAVVHDLSATSISNATVIPVRSTRGRKRKVVAVLTPETAAMATQKIKSTMKNIHMKSTLTGYQGYAREINEFYCENHPEVCDMDAKVIDRKKLLARIHDPRTIDEEITHFMTMIVSTKHSKLKQADGITPQIKRMGSLNSLRSAFNWYVFTDMGVVRTPVVWHHALTKFYAGLKNNESARYNF